MLNVHPTNEPCGCCWNCWKCCMLNCWWFTSRSGDGAAWGLLAFGFSTRLPSFPVTNDEIILDISWNCFRDGLLLYESMLESLLWPVFVLRHLPLIFSASLSEIKGNVKPNRVLELSWIYWICRAKLASLEELFNYFSGKCVFVYYSSDVAIFSQCFDKSIKYFVCLEKFWVTYNTVRFLQLRALQKSV